MLKKYRFIVFGLIIIFILFSLFSTIILNTPQKTEEPRIQAGENSIFNGYIPSELAENLAIAIEANPLISEEKENHGGVTWYKYHYQDDYAIEISLLENGSFWTPQSVPFNMYRSYNQGTHYINISNNSSKATELVLNIWKRFLNNLDYQLNENDYNISMMSWSSESWAWKVFIRQVFGDNIPLMNTGVVAHIEKETSRINTLSIYEWSRKKIEKNTSISFEEAKDIVYNNNQVSSTNRLMVNFTGYLYSSGDVHYRFLYLQEGLNENNPGWKVYRFYVNVETGKFQYNIGLYFGSNNESAIYEREKYSSRFGMY